jgi:hypothetical protein
LRRHLTVSNLNRVVLRGRIETKEKEKQPPAVFPLGICVFCACCRRPDELSLDEDWCQVSSSEPTAHSGHGLRFDAFDDRVLDCAITKPPNIQAIEFGVNVKRMSPWCAFAFVQGITVTLVVAFKQVPQRHRIFDCFLIQEVWNLTNQVPRVEHLSLIPGRGYKELLEVAFYFPWLLL